MIEKQKRAAALAAVMEVEHGMIVGLGTGSTAAYAAEVLAARMRSGLSFTVVATSLATEAHALRAGLALVPFDDLSRIDLAIDGVDEIDGQLRAIKGGGGAMVREKIIASAARRMVAIADSSKAVRVLGARPLPVEVLPLARSFVAEQLGRLGCTASLRRDANGLTVRTDQGNLILDCREVPLADPAVLARAIDAVPGVVGHGLFLTEIDALYLGGPDGVVRTERTG